MGHKFTQHADFVVHQFIHTQSYTFVYIHLQRRAANAVKSQRKIPVIFKAVVHPFLLSIGGASSLKPVHGWKGTTGVEKGKKAVRAAAKEAMDATMKVPRNVHLYVKKRWPVYVQFIHRREKREEKEKKEKKKGVVCCAPLPACTQRTIHVVLILFMGLFPLI